MRECVDICMPRNVYSRARTHTHTQTHKICNFYWLTFVVIMYINYIEGKKRYVQF